MIHAYDTMSSVVGQLNILNKDYNGQGKARTLPKTPDFVVACIDRALVFDPDMIVDKNKSASIDMTVLSGTGNSFSPVYICTVDNIRKAYVDKVSVIVDHKNDHGPGIATIVIVPSGIFNDTMTSDEVGTVLRDIYFGIMGMDPYTAYKSSPALLQFYNSTKIHIPTYDIEMAIVAICCMNINMRSWFYNGGEHVDPDYTLSVFTDKEVPKNIKLMLRNVLSKCFSVSDLRDAIGNGRLLERFMYID